MQGPAGEMPFLDHLEELRQRVFRILGALFVGVGAGIWLVQALDLISFLKRPIEPYLPDGRLTVLSPTEPIMILLKLGLVVGLVLTSPWMIYQIWAFLSPALYDREKKILIPALFFGMLLFVGGAIGGYLLVVPPALNFLLNIEPEALQTLITFQFYFSFVIQISLAMGLSFELPLIMILLTWLGLVTPAKLARFRQYAVVLSLVAAAFLTPADVTSMLMLGSALILLYEVGIIGSKVVARRRLKRAAHLGLILLAASLGAVQPAQGQERADSLKRLARPQRQTPLQEAGDSGRVRGQVVLDSASARRLGLPSSPTRTFAPPDEVMRGLLARPGYQVTRYQADSATLLVQGRRIELRRNGLTERGTTVLEAHDIVYQERICRLDARGDPRLFDGEQVLVGDEVSYDACAQRGVVDQALTSFQQQGANWFLRGNVAQDSSASRVYAASSGVTSCDLPTAHYHFQAKEVKWMNETMLVARPAVLYVRDVPILWLPFVFQDISPGRRSGILIPRFGINDIVRTDRSYNRQVTNVGYYWAPNDYLDLTGRLDWFSNRYTNLSFDGRYRFLDRFMNGGISVGRTWEDRGSTSTRLRWNHLQDFNLNTRLNLDLNYESNTQVRNDNAVDPRVNVQQISSSMNFTKRLRWGSIALGGSRRQSVTDGSIQTQFPSLTVSPKPIDITRSVTWSPTFTVAHSRNSGFAAGTLPIVIGPGQVDTLELERSDQTTTVNFGTPLRFGTFNWSNSVSYSDTRREERTTTDVLIPDPNSSNPADSVLLSRVTSGTFQSGLDWQTGINLPLLFRGSWKLQPAVNVVNVATGPFAVRNQNTNGDWVLQSKRAEFRLTATPTLFAFLPGIGSIGRIRHAFSPVISYSLAPRSSIPEDYAAAITPVGQQPRLFADAQHRISVGLSQNFEGKASRADDDTAATTNARKFRILGWQTSPMVYDFEQAKQPGRTGWATQSITNSFQSDMLPGFNLRLTHDLWRGTVGVDTAGFDPFLNNVSANFTFTSRTVKGLLGIFGIGGGELGGEARVEEDRYDDPATGDRRFGRGGTYSPLNQLGRRESFRASVNYTLTRTRDLGPNAPGTDRQNLGFQTGFSPTPFWNVSWSTQYNITDSRFESHVLRLDRDLHKWRARFEFVRNPNGNFAFFFSVFLTSLPDIKLDYDQSTITQ